MSPAKYELKDGTVCIFCLRWLDNAHGNSIKSMHARTVMTIEHHTISCSTMQFDNLTGHTGGVLLMPFPPQAQYPVGLDYFKFEYQTFDDIKCTWFSNVQYVWNFLVRNRCDIQQKYIQAIDCGLKMKTVFPNRQWAEGCPPRIFVNLICS